MEKCSGRGIGVLKPASPTRSWLDLDLNPSRIFSVNREGQGSGIAGGLPGGSFPRGTDSVASVCLVGGGRWSPHLPSGRGPGLVLVTEWPQQQRLTLASVELGCDCGVARAGGLALSSQGLPEWLG